jgi:uncharacterized protein (TIGR03435 family)
MMLLFLLFSVVGLNRTSQLHAQTQVVGVASNLPSFEVISIRGHKSGYWPTFERKEFTADGFTWMNAQPQALIVYAYQLKDPRLGPNLIPGAPKWIRSEWYDIQARMSELDIEKLRKMNPQQRDFYQRQLLQSLLADRFKMKSHLVWKESRSYELVLDKNGPKNLTPAQPNEDGRVEWVDAGYGQYHAVPLDALLMLLQMQIDCPVVNKTSLTGKYSFEFKWSRTAETMPPPGASSVPQPPVDDVSRPSLFKALQEELGLKLVPIQVPLESIMIDHIEKPSPN